MELFPASVAIAPLVCTAPQLVLQLAEQLTKSEGIARHTGTFTSPIYVPKWSNFAIDVATLAASADCGYPAVKLDGAAD
ncbi:hypothetical protein KZO11_29765 [Streptomyces anulatus]|uniref:hypothetical protein n=1 Tax=Streptomyces anulatus TaxID=1892 RepID=UPI001C5D5016|nr:hypothetical protein [Streptomyces anulatus]QYA97503.1 hypothetical protein KZO11_29765 [Streptomyces anulatus]